MKNDDIGRALNRELSAISLSTEARARIKWKTSTSRQGAHRGFTVAAAAAAILMLMTGGALCLRFINRPDTPDTVAAHGASVTSAPSPTPTLSAASDAEIEGMWVADGCDTFHLYQACIMYEYKNAHMGSVEKGGPLEPCTVCLSDCCWVDLDSGEYHNSLQCEKAGRVAPIHKDLTEPMGYTGCTACVFPYISEEINEEYGADMSNEASGSETIPMPTEESLPEEAPASAEYGQAKIGMVLSGSSSSETYDGSIMDGPQGEETAFIATDSGAAFSGQYYNFTLSLKSWAAGAYDELETKWVQTSNTYVYTGGYEISDSNIDNAQMDYCWCTETGQYIHSAGNCSGMENSFAALAGPACKGGSKQICPECGDGIGRVYYTYGGTYFHAVADCSGMQKAARHTRREAYAAGKAPCPECLSYESMHPID